MLLAHHGLHTSTLAAYAKRGKGGGKAAKRQAEDSEEDGPAAAGEDEEELTLEPYEQAMSLAVRHFQDEIGRIHGGRASPGLLEPIQVQAHQERGVPLKNYGTVTARTPSLLVVSLFNTSDGEAVARSIRESPLKLQARVEGKEVHVPVPRPTLDQIKGLVRLVAQEAEKSKGVVRSARQRAMEAVKAGVKARDERARTEKQVQALTDKHINELERLKVAKDKELEALR